MKTTKGRTVLEAEKRRLEEQLAKTAEARKSFDTPAIKAELRRIFLRLGFRVRGGKLEFPEALQGPFTPDEFSLLKAFYQLILWEAEDTCWLQMIESVLSPQKGRPKQAPDPRQQAAIDERLRGGPRKLSYRQLAIKHGGSADPKEQQHFADNLKTKMKSLGLTRRKKVK